MAHSVKKKITTNWQRNATIELGKEMPQFQD
jgi:hypothetical protein